MSALKLSYHHLPSHLKPCFAYCSLFPKNSLIDKDELVSLWIAMGYVTPNEGDTLEVAGHCYFMDLLNQSFFQMDTNHTLPYKMHDLVHELAENVAGEDNSIVFEGSNNVQLQSRIRHLMINYKTDDALRLSIPSLLIAHRLRTFLLRGEVSASPPICDKLLTKFKLLRVLCLSGKDIETVPSCVGELLHLRHLDLSWNKFKTLPNSITKLVNLITLNLTYCTRLVTLPKDVCNMVSLRHLLNGYCFKLSHMPPDLGKLSQLQSLRYFKAGKAVDGDKSSSLAELDRLNISGELKVKVGHVNDGEQRWQIPTGITELYLQIAQYITPLWPTNLERLSLKNCSTIKHLQPLRCLPRLKALDLHHLKDLEYVEDEDDGQCMNETVTTSFDMSAFFPSLKTLDLDDLPKLKRWSRKVELCTVKKTILSNFHQMVASFTILQHLEINNCPELIWMPSSPKLQSLHLTNVNEELIRQMFSPHHQPPPSTTITSSSSSSTSLSCLNILAICQCHRLKTLSSEALSSLRYLKLWECPELKLHNTLNNLEELEIYNCPKLESWEEGNSGVDWDSLPSLRKLALTQLPNLETLPQCLQQRQALGKMQIGKHCFPK